jgi:hypothetical protein
MSAQGDENSPLLSFLCDPIAANDEVRPRPSEGEIAIADTDKVARLRLLRALRDLTPG